MRCVNGVKSVMGLLVLARRAFSDWTWGISDSSSDCSGNQKVQRPGFVAACDVPTGAVEYSSIERFSFP